ncbi:GMC family oxidoreductase [Bradyrhizobium elkanii]|uniref:GMC family oxidoreductase n=2 Tax=Nitrobacteraceae TaxID=41294 RepID=UPI002168C9D4|nr:GMC family oxidoreductase N-terminal domain-containing protein [Bradyrhizobium elkanii]MDI2058446.1 GMC family oxidoreductase N-terminal domain-containing protein [Bradyrhizobium sp. Mp19]MCS3446073.1 choline dehydrogenase-like flavoprotein [Bradyrhizobium elkanii]MCS3562795.1 choline dehydrogenase-like flavoprotein [Bradyrhizobium elkanii]MCW2147369.1 choline dehydrogenase-like flavoprotein [Bradyrhizobium elkanii]MCW2353549.1 choline dehydrogenase-like flavoprotein [Bradyrhizobium elkanii
MRKRKTQMSQERYDIVIVGAGAAGCVVASYLAEHTDASIALIEAGEMDRDPFIHIPAGFANILVHDRHVWKYDTVPQHGKSRAYRSGRVLGGGSSINAMCYVRGQIRDFAAWQDAVGDTGKWSYEDLLPVFMAQERNDTFHDEYHGINGGLAVQLPKGINELNQYCLKAFQEYGIPYNPDYNGESQIGVSPVQSTVGNQRRCSAVDAYLRPHLVSGRVTLLTSTTVVRILIENERAVGVEMKGNDLERITAGEVVLSAGAVHSPKILMHSGIGPARQLQQHGIAVIVDAPGVGENLHDHPMVPVRAYVKGDLGYQAAAQGLGTVKAGLRYLITKDGPASGNGIETVTHWNPSDFAADPTIQCYHAPIILNEQLGPTGDRSGVTFELVVLQPKSRGWVRLADSDPTSMPLINPNFVGEEEDLRAAVQSVRAIREVMAQESLASVIEQEMDPGSQVQSDAEIGEWVKRVVTTMWHPVGTCRMGQDEKAVVDARLRVRGVEGLRVIDASIMPNITSGNTNAPTQALARHATAMLVDDLKRA